MKHETEGGMKLHEACKSKPERRTSSYPTRLPLPWKFDQSNQPKRQISRQTDRQIERERTAETDTEPWRNRER